MVSEVQAWAAQDGSLHKSRLAALEKDAIESLLKLQIFNHGSALAVVKNCVLIAPILNALAEEALKVAKEIHDELPASTLVEPLQSETI